MKYQHSKNTLYYFIITVFFIQLLGCGGGGGGGGSTFVCGDSAGVYVRIDGNDTNPGTISQPLLTIQAATGCAQPGQTIHVANGTYQSNMNSGHIWLTEGKSIYGGYSSDYQVRNPSVYPTIITDVTDMSINSFGWSTVVSTDQETTSATILDGFTINGTTVGIGGGEVHAINISGSPTISNNIINGGGNGATNYARTVQIQYDSTGAVIKNNIITSGISTGISWGIESYATGPITISNNTINGGSSNYSTRAIDISMLSTAGSIISNNIINGGNSGESYGIYFKAASPIIIEANTIHSAIYGIYTESGAPIIRNNVIELDSISLYGVYNVSNSIISNNTIVGGGNNSWGIYTKLATSAIFQNNIIEITGGTCIAEDDASSDPATLKNNNLMGCATLYYDEGTTNITSIIAINALSITDASANVSTSSNLDDTKDYQLTMSSPTAVTQGGLDLSNSLNIDKAGNDRTVPWSIGAYEYD